MKYLWWIIGDPNAPAWVSAALALVWLDLAYMSYKRHGWSFDVAFCAACFGARLAMCGGRVAG